MTKRCPNARICDEYWRRSRHRRPAADPTLVYENTTQGLKALRRSGGSGTLRGPTGVISSNRADGAAVAEHIGADVPQGEKPGRGALETLLRERRVRHVSYAEWKKIEAAEAANATPPAPRRKFVTVKDMLAVLDEADARPVG